MRTRNFGADLAPASDASIGQYGRLPQQRPSIWHRGAAALGAYAACWLAMAAPVLLMFVGGPKLMWIAFAGIFLMPAFIFAYQLVLLSRGQTIAHSLAHMVVRDRGSGRVAGLSQMLFKYWFVVPLSHSTTIGLLINLWLIVQSSTVAAPGSGTVTLEDRLSDVVVVFKEAPRKTVRI